MNRTELIDDIYESLSVRSDIPIDEIEPDDLVELIFKGNIYKFGHVIMDIQEKHGMENLEICEPLKEFEIFKTVQDVVNFFVENKTK